MPSICFSNITVDYPSATDSRTALRALEGLSLQVEEGEALAIIGPSGCGKSTLLRLASGLMKPTAGEVAIDGTPVEGPRQATAFILQDLGLLPWKDVFRNAELGLKIQGLPRQQRRERTERALAQVGLHGFEKNHPGELSGGMQQRLALARALAMDADIMLMDEPLSALDALLREGLQDVLWRLWKDRGHTQVLVTHSIEEAVFLGSRIVVMSPRPGRIVAEIENPGMQDEGYRSQEGFLDLCTRVREALAQGAVEGGDVR